MVGNHHGRGCREEVAAMEEKHGWWRRKKKRIGLNRSHQPRIKRPEFLVEFLVRPEI
jgi:hypothetical protein